MKPSERKEKLVNELADLHKDLDVEQMYILPNHKTTKDWVANVASIFKNLDETDYQDFIHISEVVLSSGERELRKQAARDMDNFVRRKVAEWKRYDFSDLDSEKTLPKLTFGQPGKMGQPGGGGSVFIQAQNITMTGGGRISADGGDYIIHQNELNNFGTINQVITETVNNISKLTHVVSQSGLSEAEKRQLIGDIETLKAQIIKPSPDKTILKKVWNAVQVASTISGAAQLLGTIAPVVLNFLK